MKDVNDEHTQIALIQNDISYIKSQLADLSVNIQNFTNTMKNEYATKLELEFLKTEISRFNKILYTIGIAVILQIVNAVINGQIKLPT